MKVGIVVDVVLSVLIIIGVVILNNNVYFDKLALYGEPVCVSDKHLYESNKCSECDANIAKNGIFLKKFAEDYEYDLSPEKYSSVKFSDYFDSYKEYKSSFDSAFIIAVIVLLIVVAFIINSIVLIYKGVKKK